MKKKFNFCLLLVLSITTIMFNSCGKDEDTKQEETPNAVTNICLDTLSLTLTIGQDYTLTATVLPEDATDKTVTWTSSADAIATVSEGKVSAISAGTATITAKAQASTVDCVVTVVELLIFDEGIIINDVKWATCNVDKPGTFVANPEDSGMFYQWNCKVAWSLTDPMINSNGAVAWDNDMPTGSTWEKANDPSPAGWRVPTLEEIEKLLDTNKVTRTRITENGKNGYKFTDKDSEKSIFLPAAGYRRYSEGMLYHVGSRGYYWSSTQLDDSSAYFLNFYSGSADWYGYYRNYALSVRAVAE